jgi:hypothetical protein
MEYDFSMLRTKQPDGKTFEYKSNIVRPSFGLQLVRGKLFKTEEEFERVREFVLPNEPKTKDEIRNTGSVHRSKALTDEQAAALGWDFPSTENN